MPEIIRSSKLMRELREAAERHREHVARVMLYGSPAERKAMSEKCFAFSGRRLRISELPEL